MENLYKVKIMATPEFIMGHLRYGHYEGTIVLTETEYNALKENPEGAFCDFDLMDNLDFKLDDYSIDDMGPIWKVEYKEIDKYD